MLVPYRRSGYGPQQAGVDVIEVGLFRYCALSVNVLGLIS